MKILEHKNCKVQLTFSDTQGIYVKNDILDPKNIPDPKNLDRFQMIQIQTIFSDHKL